MVNVVVSSNRLSFSNLGWERDSVIPDCFCCKLTEERDGESSQLILSKCQDDSYSLTLNLAREDNEFFEHEYATIELNILRPVLAAVFSDIEEGLCNGNN